MKAIVAKHDLDTTDPAAFTLEEQPVPEPGPLDLQVRVVAIGMNPVAQRVGCSRRVTLAPCFTRPGGAAKSAARGESIGSDGGLSRSR